MAQTFRISYNPALDWRAAIVPGAIFFTVLTLSVLSGHFVFQRFALSSLTVLVVILVTLKLVKRALQGSIVLDENGITVGAGWGRQEYPWEDIAALDASTIAAQGTIRAGLARLGSEVNKPLLEIKLKRIIRQGISGKISTRGFGLPYWQKTANVWPDDPQAVVAAARPFLNRDSLPCPA